MGLSNGVVRVIAFLRAGYPTGMPATGYLPLAALARRRVTDDEIATITNRFGLRRRRPVSNVDIGVAITRVTNEMPSPDDVQRVQRRLQAPV